MRTIKDAKYLLLLAMLVAGSMFTVSCSSDDDDESTKSEEKSEEKTLDIDKDLENVTYEVVSQEALTPEQMADAVYGPDGANGDEEMQEMRNIFLKKQQEIGEKMAAEMGSNGVAIGYMSYNYKYASVDEKGEPLLLSARVYWGTYWLFGNHDLDPDYIVLCPHFTIGSDKECPTKKHTLEAAAIVGDNLLIMPDYIGFGFTKERVQPYINHNLCAQNCIDALEAGYKLFKEKTSASLEKDYKLYVIGASQGGGNALAVHKWLDTHPAFADKWRFDYSYCCAGPYDPALTFQKYFQQKKHPYPCVFPFVIKSMMAAYPDILGKWKEEDFYSEDYVSKHKSLMDQLIASKEYDCDAINKKFFEWYPHTGDKNIKGGKEIYLSDILSDEVQDENSEMYKALFKCLDDNNLTKGWTPTHTIKLYHGEGDDIVPYANAKAVVDAFPGKTKMFNSGWGTSGHLETCGKWLGTLVINNW